jgi:VWFA-related protein
MIRGSVMRTCFRQAGRLSYCRASWIAATCAVLLAVPAASIVRAGRAPASQAAQVPLFKSGIDLIAIDVNVVDKTGAPMRSLTADQFEVTVDGRPRRVLSAELVDHAPPPDAAPGDASAASAWAYSSNDRPGRSAPPGRLFFILVDQSSFRSSGVRAVITGTRRFVDHLQETDRVGLLAFPGPGPVVRASADHAEVRIALSGIVGQYQPLRSMRRTNLSLAEAADITAGDSTALSAAIERECRGLRGAERSLCVDEVREDARAVALNAEMQARLALTELRRVVEALSVYEERKTLILVSAGLPASDRSGGGLDVSGEITALARDAAKGNASLYVLHLDSSFLDAFSPSEQHLSRTVGRDASIGGSGLETLAGASGGTLLRVVAGADSAFDRVLRETSASYILGLEPSDSDRDGRPHAIRVSVKRPGALVRSRREFVLPAAARAAPATPLAAALSSRILATGVPLGVSTRTIGTEPTGGLRVLVTAKVGGGLSGPAEFTTALVVTDARGRVVITTPPATERLAVPPDTTGGSAAYLATIGLPPGDYHLRLAAVDGGGRVGSVDHSFSVALAEGDGVKMGDLVLSHPARATDDPLAIVPDGRLRGASVAAHLEVFRRPGSAAPTVTFGVADRADAELLVQTRGIVSKDDAGGGSAADAVLDLALLPPGDYFAVAVVSDGKRRLGRRYEPLHIDRGVAAESTGGAAAAAAGAPRVRFVPGLSSALVKSFTRADVLTPPALAFFADRLKAADTSPPAAAAAAMGDLRNGRFDAVLAGLNNIPSDRLSPAFLKGVALLAKGQLEPAAAELRQALRIADDFLPAAFYLGACYAAGGRDEEAVGAWQTALVTEGDARIVYDVLTDALLRLDEAEQAIEVINEAHGRWPADDGLLLRLAVGQAMLQRRGDAVATLGPYLESHRTDTEAAALALRLIYEAHAAGGVIVSRDADREMAGKYADRYRAAGGQNPALVARWMAFIGKK